MGRVVEIVREGREWGRLVEIVREGRGWGGDGDCERGEGLEMGEMMGRKIVGKGRDWECGKGWAGI